MLRRSHASLVLAIALIPGLARADSGLETATATLEVVPREQVFDGVVEAVKQATVAAQISGRITEIRFDVDDVVEKNAILLRIHDTEYKAREKQAQAGLAEAKARLKDATAEHKRIEGLVKEKMVSEAEFDKATASLHAAEARLKAAEGQLTEVEENVGNTVVRAPYSGIVTKRLVELGETVHVGQNVMAGFSLEQLRVNVDVPQAHIAAVRQFQAANIYNSTNAAVAAKKLTIFPFADAASHTFRVRADLASGMQGIYPGMLVKAGFVVDKEERLLVPSSAIVRRVEVEAVYVVDEAGKIRMRQVLSGQRFGDKTAILSGLNAGEKVALDPLRAGASLKQQSGAK